MGNTHMNHDVVVQLPHGTFAGGQIILSHAVSSVNLRCKAALLSPAQSSPFPAD